jgi:hypothetical protein
MSSEAFENLHLRAKAREAGLELLSPSPSNKESLRAENAHLEGEIREKRLANDLDDQIRTTHQVLLPMSQKVGGAIGRRLGSLLQKVSASAAERSLQRGRTGPIMAIQVGGRILSVGLMGLVAFSIVLVVFLLLFQFVLRMFATKY